MFEKALSTAANVAIIAAVGIPLHFLAGVDWPWAILIGAGASIAVRWLIRSGALPGLRKHPLAGGG